MYKRKERAKRILVAMLAASLTVPSNLAYAAPEGMTDFENAAMYEAEADFEALRNRWKILLTGGEELDTSSQLAQDYAESIDQAAGRLWNSMIKLGDAERDERTCLFSDLPMTDKKTKTGSSQITLTFDRLKAIVLAYETKGSEFYRDPELKKEIIAALDMMIENHYSVYYASGGTGTGLGSGNNSFGNWYDWRIGTPRQLCDLLLMFYDELTEEQIARYVEPIMMNNKRVDTTGANRTWIANVFVQCGVLTGVGDWIEAGRTGLEDVFKYVDKGDGFHEDGSFIQHNSYAYTGGYGKALLCTLAPMMNVLHETPYAIAYEDNREQIFYDMLFEAYEPLIYGGRFMDMAREREISRVANQDSIPGRQAIRAMIMLIDVLPEEQKARAQSMVKEWLLDDEVLAQVCMDPTDGYNEYYLPAGVINEAIDLVNSGMEARGNLVKHKRYGAMDRIVHLRDDFGFTVSMSSDRISNTEGTNDEGLRLWNIGDGLTYLYNEDKTYYSDHYWATVDHQRLPGTTVNRVPGRAPKAGYGTKNPYPFAGGTDLGEFGIAGMEMQGVGTTSRNGAHAKKSWFMFDDEIVSLGSEVRSTLADSTVETIVENRKISQDKSNTLTVNGIEQTISGGGEPTIEENKAVSVTSVTAASGKDVIATRTMEDMAANQEVIVSCKVKMPSATDFFAIKLYGSGDGSENNNIVFLTMRNGALVPRIPNSGNKDAYSSDAALPANEWHEIKVVLNMADQTYNYYFDGTHIKKGISTGSTTIAADLENAGFYSALTGGNNKLTGVEIMAPGSKAGTIQVDDIQVTCKGTPVYQDDFEGCAPDDPLSTLAQWSVKINDTGAGAGAKIELEQNVVIPESYDTFNGVHEDTEWIHLAGNSSASDTGYYFPGKAAISGLRETRIGSWELVNIYEKFVDREERINSFATFWFDHGEKPADDSYSFVTLPGKSADATAAYNENPDIEILRQDGTAHVVREKNLGITGINFFEAGKHGAFRTEQPASVMYREEKEERTMEISFSDPTQRTRELKLEAALPIEEVLEQSEEIQVSQKNGITTFTAVTERDPKGIAGKSFTVKVRLGANDNMFESCEPGDLPEHWNKTEGNAGIIKEQDGNQALEVEAGSGTGAEASTTLIYPENIQGSFISFQLKLMKGSGNIRLGDENGDSIQLNFTEKAEERASEQNLVLTPEEWHTVKIKLNLDENSYVVMLDGEMQGARTMYEGDVPSLYTLSADAASTVRLDNLVITEASTVPPTRPQRLTYTGYGDRSADLKWDRAESENPVYYVVTVNGEEIEELITETNYTVTGLEPEETYLFTVYAIDDDENYSEISNELSVTTIEAQDRNYVINFDGYEETDEEQNRWSYGGTDKKGTVEILKAPEGKDSSDSEDLMTDMDYWAEKASTSNASAIAKATGSNAETATSSNAAKASDVDQALYIYSGTSASGVDRSASYRFEKQTKKQTYRLKLYFDESVKYSNFALVGSDGKQAVTMMITEGGLIGYRAGDAPGTTKQLTDTKLEGEWITFEITADPETQKFSISANGIEKADLQFRNATADIEKITFNAPGSAIGGFYVDDIVLPGENTAQVIELKELTEDLSEPLTVPYDTDFYDLELPEYVSVNGIYADGEEEEFQVRVNWIKEDYDGTEVKVHTIQGELAYSSNCVNRIPDSDIRIKVEVEKEIPIYRVSLVQTSGGTISSDTVSAEEGSDVTVEAEADDGYHLTAWKIDEKTITTTDESYTFALESDVTVRAVFEADDVRPEVHFYTVKIGSGIKGGSVSASAYYAEEGTEIVVTVTAEEGYRLLTLKVNGKEVSPDEDGQYTFILTKNSVITARFMEVESEEEEAHDDRDEDSSEWTRSTAPSYAETGIWETRGDRWTLRSPNGSLVTSRWACILWNGSYEWYYFGADGAMQTGWIELDGKQYYLHATPDGTRGRMVTGWTQIDGKWYYFQEISDGNRGMLLKNTTTPDGYHIGADGVWIEE